MGNHHLGILLFICLFLTACGGDEEPPVSPPVATGCPEPDVPAPDLRLVDLDGVEHDLSDYRCDKVVLLDFWASWCAPCRDGMPLLQELHDTYADQGLLVLAVNMDEDEMQVRRFIAEAGYQFTVLLDPDNAAAGAYEVGGIPRQVIIDASGEIRYDRTGLNAISLIGHHTTLPVLLAELTD